MDIGSAKVEKSIQDDVRHHVIDIVDVTTPFSGSDFCTYAKEAMMVRGVANKIMCLLMIICMVFRKRSR